MWPFSKRRRISAPHDPWDLSTPLLRLGNNDVWTIGDACQGTQVFGGTGSGKSTGPISLICRNFLLAGFGGLFLTSKPTDRDDYIRWCRETGRLEDLRIFGINEPLRFNPLQAELLRQDAGAGLTENIIGLLSTLLEVAERDRGQGGMEESGYWKRANRQLMRNAVDLLVLAHGRLSVPDLYRLVVSAPTSLEQLRSEEWKRNSFCFQCLAAAERKPKSPRQFADFELIADFFLVEFVALSERTRSVVVSTFTSMLDVLNRGVIRDLMSSETNVTPEMAQEGAIFLIDLPLKVFGEVGLFTQILWKYCFQQAMERRDISGNSRPVFLVTDESHFTAVSRDQLFQTTARSSRTAVLNATQNLSNYLAAFGDKAEAEVHSLLGNLQTQIFCQQADIKTNLYAAELIGRTKQFLMNCNNSQQPQEWYQVFPRDRGRQVSMGMSETFEYEVQPSRFAQLRKGGPPHWQVDAIWYQGGRRFGTSGRSWMSLNFDQHVSGRP